MPKRLLRIVAVLLVASLAAETPVPTRPLVVRGAYHLGEQGSFAQALFREEALFLHPISFSRLSRHPLVGWLLRRFGINVPAGHAEQVSSALLGVNDSDVSRHMSPPTGETSDPSAETPPASIETVETRETESGQSPAAVLRIPRMSRYYLDSDIRLAFDVVAAFDPTMRPAMAYILEPRGLETVRRMAGALEGLLMPYPEIAEPAVLFAVDFLWYWGRRWPQDEHLQRLIDNARSGRAQTVRLGAFLRLALAIGIPELYQKIEDLQMFVALARGMERLSQRLSDLSLFAKTLTYSERLLTSKYLNERTYPLRLAGLWEFVLDIGWLERHERDTERNLLFMLVFSERILGRATLQAVADMGLVTQERIRQVEDKILAFIAADGRRVIRGDREGEFIFDFLEYMRTRPLAERLAIDVDQLDLSVRTHNGLKNADLDTIAMILEKTEAELLRTKNFGEVSLNELKKILKKLDLPDPGETVNLEHMRGKPLAERLALEITEVVMSVRCFNGLINADLDTIGRIVAKTEAELLRTKNFGEVSLNELKEILGKLDLHLADSTEPPNFPDRGA